MVKSAVAVPEVINGDLLAKFESKVVVAGVEDPNAVSARIVASILERDSLDSILDAGDASAISVEDVGAKSFRLTGAPTWLRSGYEASESMLPVFVILPVEVAGEGPAVVSCGATNVLAQLYAADAAGKPDMEGRWLRFKGVQTARNNTAYWLQRGEAPFDASDKATK